MRLSTLFAVFFLSTYSLQYLGLKRPGPSVHCVHSIIVLIDAIYYIYLSFSLLLSLLPPPQ